jgi:hypothetical protein
MKKTLNAYRIELLEMSFDKRKVQGLVKRANKDGYDLYYAYHEDGQDTWKRGWSADDYKKESNDVKLFEATDLIQKKKPTRNFTRAETYTAECTIFVFCPIQTLLADPDLRELKIESVKNHAAKYAEADYERAKKRMADIDIWEQLPAENRQKISELDKQHTAIFGQIGSNKTRKELEAKINELGGFRPTIPNYATWIAEAASFKTLAEYTEFRQNKAVASLLNRATEAAL